MLYHSNLAYHSKKRRQMVGKATNTRTKKPVNP
nr:MAG TPA: hypothetical protein [Caudoviricetes sp.]